MHGSYVLGDYQPDRSDLDLLAVLAADPTASTLARLAAVHDALTTDAPESDGHVEVDYVSAAGVQAALRGAEPHPMVRISPGEPLHLTAATAHYLLNWWAASSHGRVLHCSPASELLPPIPVQRVRAVVLDHLRQWPQWAHEAQRAGNQAYAVLTVCRGVATLDTGTQLSKRGAADYGERRYPSWSPLIGWARDWWYAGGRDDEPGHFAEVVGFVTEVAGQLEETDVAEATDR